MRDWLLKHLCLYKIKEEKVPVYWSEVLESISKKGDK